MPSATATSVFRRDGDAYVATGLARGPWDENAQHGGAPAALLAHVAERTAGDAFFMARLTFELSRPVPVAALTVTAEASRGRSARRVHMEIRHDGAPVGRATALMLREQPVETPAHAPRRLEPGPEDCEEGFETPGMPHGESFYDEAMDIRVARGSTLEPGPTAAWFRLTVPLIAGQPNTPAMRAAAAADFGNGISWTLPFSEFLYTNPDLTLYLHRAPVGDWIGLDSETIAQPNGIGLASSTLFDERGRIGMAHQSLLIRPR